MAESPVSTTEFVIASDRLVRHMLDVGLQLNALRVVFDSRCSTPADLRAVSAAAAGALEDLDLLIRDAGLAMLTLACQGESDDRSRWRLPAHP